MKEIWKDIEYGYKVSNTGEVKSLAKEWWSGKDGCIYRSKPETIMQQVNDRIGYKVVNLRINGKSKMVKIHRLVAQTFIPNPDNLPQVNHIDGDKSNNHVSNLEWCTSKENHKHAFKTGLRIGMKGERNGASKLTEKQVIEIKKLKGTMYQKDIAKKYGVTNMVISKIMNNKIWKHVEYGV